MADKVRSQAIICCSWFKAHTKGSGKLSGPQLEWLSQLDYRDSLLMSDFPIYCVIKALPDEVLVVPYLGKLAVVVGYKHGYLVVKANPSDENVKRVSVRPDKVEKISNWRGVTPKKLKNMLLWHEQKKKKDVK